MASMPVVLPSPPPQLRPKKKNPPTINTTTAAIAIQTGVESRGKRPRLSAAASACSTLLRPTPLAPGGVLPAAAPSVMNAPGSSMVGGPAILRPAYAGGCRYPPPADGGAYGDAGWGAGGGGGAGRDWRGV